MDYSKIFLKEAVPTSIGGQAIMEGVMMRSEPWTAIALRLPDDRIYLKREKNKPKSGAYKIPFVRGVFSFFDSFVSGMKTLMDSADVLEQFMEEDEEEEPAKESFIEKHFGERAAWNFAMFISLIFAFVISIAVFVIFPTWAGGFLEKHIENSVLLNLAEGLIRILLFVLYILLISKMKDIKKLFQYHGAEHKTIHTFENGLELVPDNARQFETLHPRCGTSFVMFVFIISLLLFSFLGWPNLMLRIVSRIALLPVIAGISYELLKLAGRSDNILVKILSTPGLMLQKITTNEPTDKQLEIAMVSLKAVLGKPDEPEMEAIVDKDMNIIKKISLKLAGRKKEDKIKVNAGGVANPAASREEESDKLEFELYIDPRSVAGVIAHGAEVLAAARKPNAKHDATEIFCYAMGYSHADIITRSTEVIFADDIKEYDKLIEKRASGVPLQYIIKVQGFMGHLIRVNSDVLIPRLDTEILVEQTIGLIKGKNIKAPVIADVCTGSGAIGISLAHVFPNAEVTMTDISDKAISTAISNAQINSVYSRCMFLTGDMFDALYEGKLYDIITCNPPYIREDIIDTLDEEVKNYEPLIALNGGEDGLKFYRIIASKASSHLKSGGNLVLEIGSEQAEEVTRLLAFTGDYERISTVKDLAGLDRVIVAEKK